MAQQCERAIDGGCGQQTFLASGADLGRQPLRLVLGDPACGEIGERRVAAEHGHEVIQDPFVLLERALPRLHLDVPLGGFRERDAARRLALVDVQEKRRERLLGIFLRPLGLVDALLLAVHLDGVAPCSALCALDPGLSKGAD
jgi:hypothetical protein